MQLERLSGDRRFDQKFLQRIVVRERLKLELEKGLTDELFERCLASNDAGVIHILLQEVKDLTPE